MQDGYIALFALLAVGIICFPVPEETLMILAGYLIAKGKWPAIPTFIAAIGGSICGITVSYILGLTAGSFLLKKYGHMIGITEQKIKYVQDWFNKIGKWALFIGYFIIGVRHFTGYVAGAALLRFKLFALYAYSGAFVWGITFISLGYFLSDQLDNIIQIVNIDELFIVIIGFLLICLGWYLIKRR
jgi:membrane protein DedA with SNARE-associated domain